MNHEYFCVLLSQQLWIQTEMFNLLWQQILTLSWPCCFRSSLNDGVCLIAVAAILLLHHLVRVAFAATPLGISNPFQLLSQQPGCFT